MLLSGVVCGRLLDRYAPHRLMIYFAIPLAFVLWLMPSVSTLWMVLALGFGIGVLRTMFDVGGNLLVLWTYPEDNAIPLTASHLTFGLGSFIAPFAIGLWLSAHPETIYTYWGGGALFLVLPLLLLIAIFFIYVGVEVAFGAWVFTYATDVVGIDEKMAAYATATFWGMFTVGRFILIFLTRWFSIQQLLTLTFFGSMAFLLLLLFVPESAVMLWIVTVGFGMLMAGIFPMMMQFTQSKMEITGKVMSIFYIGAGSGAMVVPPIAGYFLGAVSPQSFSLFFCGLLLFAYWLLHLLRN